MNVLWLPVLIVGLIGEFRLLMMMLGTLKGPMLTLFEKYGGEESFFNPIPWFVIWAGVILIGLGGLFSLSMLTSIVGWLIIATGYILTTLPPNVQHYMQTIAPRPRWYIRLCRMTVREERRMVAYRWLWLSPRTRAVLNVNDRAFFHWVDLIVLTVI